jgi:hypothetical protein
MRTEKSRKESPSPISNVICTEPPNEAHLVFISDEYGISSVFEQIIALLRSDLNRCLTLIYATSGLQSQAIFRAELESLEKRFPSQLVTHYLIKRSSASYGNPGLNLQILEVVINCNIKQFIKFLVVGYSELVESVTDRLCFLGIDSNQIYSQTIYSY